MVPGGLSPTLALSLSLFLSACRWRTMYIYVYESTIRSIIVDGRSFARLLARANHLSVPLDSPGLFKADVAGPDCPTVVFDRQTEIRALPPGRSTFASLSHDTRANTGHSQITGRVMQHGQVSADIRAMYERYLNVLLSDQRTWLLGGLWYSVRACVRV